MKMGRTGHVLYCWDGATWSMDRHEWEYRIDETWMYNLCGKINEKV